MTDNCVELKTVQASSFKVLIEALKELLTDTCIEFDETGLKVVAMDASHVVLVHLKLDADKFEYFHCNRKVTIGINMINFHKLIKTINSNDTLTLFLDDNINHLGIRIENVEKNTRTTYQLNLLEMDKENLFINPVDFNLMITMPSSDFQKICRDMKNLADFVEIRSINSQLVFSCQGDFCSQETVITDNQNGIHNISSKTDGIVQGVFNLKYLVLFTKCTNLSNTVELYMKNDYPLVVNYNVASLGAVKMILAPQTN